MTEPLTFTDAQLLEALRDAPEQTQAQVAIIAMQIELQERRTVEAEEENGS